MSDRTVTAMTQVQEADERYHDIELLVDHRIETISGSLFQTSAEGSLFKHYLMNLREDRRQHYNCWACQRFIDKYGSLAHISDDGQLASVLWTGLTGVPDFFRASVDAMAEIVKRSMVTGLFYSAEGKWGEPVSKKGWTHLSGTNPCVHKSRTTSADQLAAEKKQDYIMLKHAMSDFSVDMLKQAVRVLSANELDRSEKMLGVAQWALELRTKCDGLMHRFRDNVIWLAVATAPAGFCHLRSSMISTLLDDIKTGLPFETIKSKWDAKMHPQRYQRPQAAPSEGTIKQAEALVEKLGAASALERRYATLDDILVKLWTPKEVITKHDAPRTGGVFDHLRKSAEKVKEVELPPKSISAVKFIESVVPTALTIDCKVPAYSGSFYALTTAVHPDAAAILQWDTVAEGVQRNPVSWYFHSGTNSCEQWSLQPTWTPVTCVFAPSFTWQQPERFKHLPFHYFFALQGCREIDDANGRGAGLFPETLKAEFHGIRSVIAAHDRKSKTAGREQGNANGIAVYEGTVATHGPHIFRVTTTNGSFDYRIDRWE